jgi:hypothetical protein
MSINRVSGCDQMYCTLCEVPFSWATGQVVQGVIHNPHFFERLRELRQEDECGWPSMGFVSGLDAALGNVMRSLHRTATNIQHVHLIRLANFQRRGADNEDLRVSYCLDELSETGFKSKLEQRECRRALQLDVREVLEVFVLSCMELAYKLRGLKGKEAQEALISSYLSSTEGLVNEPLHDLCIRYHKPTTAISIPAPEEWKTLYHGADLFQPPAWFRTLR